MMPHSAVSELGLYCLPCLICLNTSVLLPSLAKTIFALPFTLNENILF